MSFVGDAALSAIPVLGSAIAGASNASAMKDAYKHRYQWEVADLKKAGLNPALAYGHQPGTPQVGTMPDLGSSAAQGVQAMGQRKVSAQQARLTAAQAGLLEAQTADLIQNLKLKNGLLGEQIGSTRATTNLTNANIPLVGAKVAETQAHTASLGQGVLESQERINLIRRQAEVSEAEAKKIHWATLALQNDVRFQNATFGTRVQMLRKELEQMGVNLQIGRLNKLGLDLGLAEKRAEEEFWKDAGVAGSTGARELTRMILQFLK